MNYFCKKTENGVTLIEIVVVTAIMVILSAIALFSLSSFQRTQVFTGTEGDIVALLDKARGDTLASKSSQNYSVHFESSRMVFFTGSTFTDGLSTNIAVAFDSKVTLSAISLAGGRANVTFDRLTGGTSENGTLTLSIVGDN